MHNKKALDSRIKRLEQAMAPTQFAILCWNDDEVEELAEFVARRRRETGFDGKYFVCVGVSGQWVARAGEPNVWDRPSRAARRYETWGGYEPPLDTSTTEKAAHHAQTS